MKTVGRSSKRIVIAAVVAGMLTVPVLTIPEAYADTRAPVRISSDPRPLVIAHRGFSSDMPENTIPAMIAAASAGADMVEIDVQQTKDHALVVVHDKTFARTTDVAKVFPGRANDPISSFTLAEVRRLDAGSWKGTQFIGTPVPTLAELLRAIAPTPLKLLLELKNPRLYPGYEMRVAVVLAEHGLISRRRVYVHSFNASALRQFHRAAPTVPIGLITKTGVGNVSRERWLQTVNPADRSITDSSVDRAQVDHLAVFSWPGSPGQDSTGGIARLVKDGVDGIITNHPDVAIRLVDQAHPAVE